MIKITSDFHSHTIYSHGTGTILDNALVAREKGLNALATTDHGVRHPFVGVNRKMFDTIIKDMENVQKKVPEVKLLFGIESNIIGLDGDIDLSDDDIKKMDVVLAGFHLTSYPSKFREYFSFILNGVTHIVCHNTKGQMERNTRAYLNCVKKHPIDILTHSGFRLDIDYKEVGKCCSDYGTYFEISSRHKVPKADYMEELLATDVKFIIDSDAHKPENIGSWEYALDIVNKFNIPEERIVNCNGKIPEFRSKR